MTQKDDIYWHMVEHGSITTREALKEYGCINLSAVIKELTNNGVKIHKDKVRDTCDNGLQTIVSRYSIDEE